jgi:hypothetical protein
MRFHRPAAVALILFSFAAACGDSAAPGADERAGVAESAAVSPPPPVLVGSLANFDALNDTGQEA